MNELDQFQALDTAVETTEVKSAKNEEKKQMIKMYKEAMDETLKNNPDYVNRRRSLTGCVRVVNTLGFGATGGLILAEGSTKENRKIQTVSAIVGYVFENIGDKPIPYVTEEFAPNAEGVWVGQKVKKVLNPGEKVALSRKNATILFSQPEFNLRVANGKFIPPKQKNPSDLEALLSGYYFSFDDKNLKVNSDAIKLQIGEERKTPNGTKWFVKPEYEVTFGYLNNSGTGKTRQKKATADFDAQDYAANYIQKLLEQAGL